MAHETAEADDERYEWEKYDPKRRFLRYVGLLFLFVIGAISWRLLNIRYDFVATAPRELGDLLVRMTPPNLAYSTQIVGPLIETVNIAILGTGLAIIMSLPVAYIGAENTTPNRFTYLLGKVIIVTSRSVNVIVWALFFVVIFGTGALSGVLAVAFRSIGFVSKLISEGIEEIDPGQVEAIEATGASGIDVLVYGVVPQVKPLFVGIATYRWDINVREATIIGFVGAGGIGVELTTRIDYFDWRSVLTILIAILGIVLISEAVSAYLRKKVS